MQQIKPNKTPINYLEIGCILPNFFPLAVLAVTPSSSVPFLWRTNELSLLPYLPIICYALIEFAINENNDRYDVIVWWIRNKYRLDPLREFCLILCKAVAMICKYYKCIIILVSNCSSNTLCCLYVITLAVWLLMTISNLLAELHQKRNIHLHRFHVCFLKIPVLTSMPYHMYFYLSLVIIIQSSCY